MARPGRPAAAITLDKDNEFEAALIEMVKLHRAKSHDYAGDDDPYQNFYDTSTQVNTPAGQSCEVFIAQKAARLKQLVYRTKRKPKNEAVRDTIRDRAVYSVIALVLFDRGDYEKVD
jgi:hypothetical protein